MKNTKELEDIIKAIRKWIKKHKGEVVFVGSFAAFKGKDCKIVDDLIIGFGGKGEIQISLEGLRDMLCEEKKDFINW